MCKKIQFYYYTYLFSSVFSFNKSEDVITTYRLYFYYNLSVWKLKYEYNVFSLSHDTITVQPFSGIYPYMGSR